MAKTTFYSSSIPTIPPLEKWEGSSWKWAHPVLPCPSKEPSPESSWQWCWLANLWMEPRPRLVPSHCEPPASALLSTDPLLPWKHNCISRRVVAASFIISCPAREGSGLQHSNSLLINAIQGTSVPYFSKNLYGLNWQNPFQGTESSRGKEALTSSYCQKSATTKVVTKDHYKATPGDKITQGWHKLQEPGEILCITKFSFLKHFSKTVIRRWYNREAKNITWDTNRDSQSLKCQVLSGDRALTSRSWPGCHSHQMQIFWCSLAFDQRVVL